MVSGVSFKNPNSHKDDLKKKRAISSGLLFGVVLMILVGLSYVGVLFYGKAQEKQAEDLDETILANKERIDAELEGSAADLYAKSQAVQQIAQVEKATDALLANDFQSMIVQGIVFRGFAQQYDYQTGLSTVEITADGPSYDVIAAQINVWKNSDVLSDVRVTSIARDDESQFIIFTTEFIIAPSEGLGPYGTEFRINRGSAGLAPVPAQAL